MERFFIFQRLLFVYGSVRFDTQNVGMTFDKTQKWDHAPIDAFRNLNLRWTNSQDHENFSVNSNNITNGWYGGTYVGNRNNFYGGHYNMALDYNYSGQDVQNLQIRIYSNEPTSNWLPYSD